jgi:lysyl-tRNA synthetase, class II
MTDADLPDEAEGAPEQVRVRLAKAERLRAAGIDPYPVVYPRTHMIAEIREEFGGLPPDAASGVRVGTAGRVMLRRDGGKLCFARIRDGSGEIQVMLSLEVVGANQLAAWKQNVDLGDHVGVTGAVISSRSGELSVLADSFEITAKALRPLPDKRHGLTDAETRVRQRYLDLIVNPTSVRMAEVRAAVTRSIREELHVRGFLEAETPVLQTLHGGANARPFATHINAYDLNLYLRIALELYLKRLLVGGIERVYELGRIFRNEGADATHNPEFTMLEAYQAYGDYNTMATLTTDLLQAAARTVYGAEVARRPDGTEFDISGRWREVTVHRALSEALGAEITPDTSEKELRAHAETLGTELRPDWNQADVVLELYEHLVERRTVQPTFYRDFPVGVSPLTRRHREDARLAERWDLVAFGTEIATGYSELSDPVEQRARLTEQALLAASGDPDAMHLDEEFLLALEHGMPPSGGVGMGVDRALIMLTGAPVRETVLFPLVKPT